MFRFIGTYSLTSIPDAKPNENLEISSLAIVEHVSLMDCRSNLSVSLHLQPKGHEDKHKEKQATDYEDQIRACLTENVDHVTITTCAIEIIFTHEQEAEDRKKNKENWRFIVFDEIHATPSICRVQPTCIKLRFAKNSSGNS